MDSFAEGAGTITEAAGRWADRLARWAIPDAILAQAPVSPWQHDTAMFAVDDTLDRHAGAAEIARAVLPVSGGSVLDVGCGGGRAAMSLVPPAGEVIGVDQSPAMLAEFERAARAVGVRSTTVEGRWPDVAAITPSADVVVCHHVAYNVADIEPFLLALTDHARLAVVLVLPPRHPLSAWNDAWRHFWGLERPTEPTADDLAEVLAGLGLDAERWEVPRPTLARATADPASRVASARRRLCLSEERDDEIAAYLEANEPKWPDTNVVFRWPGSAGDDRTASDETYGDFPLRRYLGMELHGDDPGIGFAEIEVGPEHLNPNGVVHGAVLFALVDTAMGKSTMSVVDEPGAYCASIELSLRFIRPAVAGRLLATARVVKRGRSVVHLDADVVGDDSRLVATAAGTFAILGG